ncbi:TIGR03857 family LLM class F420-dependent oxidoreductase [Mycolicibacterium porcinum]|uniref:TIGR03857 family LLM class F420-dependent oxidoreductase n=1 Tax=Mycolicibacterium porcinum TaxID=39693 RepID=UPI001194C1E3|nr:TIGR03857 family LLM class F420-dependent oxidoreductase [Mycolicibacterium porcinum]TVX99229.1 TIGR03857 family LLM class F420-dependent oxidoreductase [Mycolicibacterium porcinum]
MSTPPFTEADAGVKLSAYLISGAVCAERRPRRFDTEQRTVAEGIEDGIDADALGFHRVFVSERYDIKHADVLISGIAARTSHVQLATGTIDPQTRQIWNIAALGATLQACYGPRFTLCLGLGDDMIFTRMGLRKARYREMVEYAQMYRALWRGETVSYTGQSGSFENFSFSERYGGPAPRLWLGTFGNPRGAKAAAEGFDGVLLPPVFTPRATAVAVSRIRQACQDIGRDPATMHICQSVITAPDLDEEEWRQLAHGRATSYFVYPGYGEALAKVNGWDERIMLEVRRHPMFRGLGKVADMEMHRHQMMDAADLIPDDWMLDSCAFGTAAECATNLQRFADAGVDEITTYGSTPAQNSGLLTEWKRASR